MILIGIEGFAVVAVGNSVAHDPLIIVISSLGLYCCHLQFFAKIHLEPLIFVISSGGPCASFTMSTPEMEPGIGWAVCRVITAGSCNLSIGYGFLLHPKGF